MRFRHIVWIPAFLAASLAATASAANLPPAANAGIQWLQTQLNADGSLANESLSIASPLQARSETATALGLAGHIPASLTGAVASDTGTDTESLSRHVIALVQGGQDPSASVQALYANQNADGGFGSLAGDSSNPLDTAFALLALRTANNANANNLSNALLYMVGSVGADGGYGLPAGGSGSQLYVTSYVLLAYQAYAGSYPLAQQISGARHWLTAQQAGGVYNDTLSDAIGVLALAASSSDASVYNGALNALSAAQQADGSWGDDPYLTAMAVRALGVGVAQAAASTGSISGTVLDAVSHLPLAGATVQLTGTASTSAATNASGSVLLSGLVPGAYAVTISAAGYTPVSLQAVQVSAGSATTLGAVLLTAGPAAGGLGGVLTDANGTPLAGAVITLSGVDNATLTSGANGAYSFSGLAAGQVVVTVSLAGYDTITLPVQVTAGLVLQFSPSLYPAGTTPAATSLSGSVVDALTQQPISGATVTVGGASVQTDGNGHFSLSGLTAGSYSASISATGYSGATLSGELAGGGNAAGSIALTALGSADNTSSLSGTVTDGGTHAPLLGVSVQVQGTGIAAITDASGRYQLTGIPGSQFMVSFTAAGYLSHQSGVSLAAPGALVLNAALTAAGSTGIQVQSVQVDQPAHDPYTEAELTADIANSTGNDEQVTLDAKVLDAVGNVVQDIPAIGQTLSTPPSATLQTVPAGGDLTQRFTFHVRDTTAGNYRILVQATDASGDVVAEGGTAVTINALAQIGGGLKMDPPITQANSQQPIHITGNLANAGNLPVPAGQLQLTVTVADNSTPSALPTPNVALGTYFTSNTTIAGMTRDPQGNVYVVNVFNDNRIIKIAPDKTSTVVKALPTSTKINGVQTTISPVAITRDPSGNFWVLNTTHWLIRVDPAGTLSFFDTGLTTLHCVDADANGNLYITGFTGTNTFLLQMSPSGQFTTLVQNGLSKPMYTTTGPSGDLFVTNFGDNTISRIAVGGVISSFVTGLNGPQGIAADPAGNLYVANSGTNSVVMITPTGVVSTYATGFNDPSGVAYDGAGSLYVTNLGDNTISKVAPDGTVSLFAQSAASNPQGLRYDAQGNLYIANQGTGTVSQVDTAGKVHVLASGLSSPEQTALDPSGNLFVTNSGSGSVSEIAGGVATTYATGLTQPWGIVSDGAGNLYVSEASAGRISEIPAGSTTPQTFSVSLLRSPKSVITAPDGSLIVANNGSIAQIPLGGGNGQILAAGVGAPSGLSYDQNGTLYYTNGSSLFKVVNGTATLFATIASTQSPVIFDAAGNYYVADNNNKRILKVSGGTSTVFATLTGSPTYLAADPAGNLYTVVANSSVWKISSTGVATQIVNSHLVSGINSITADGSGHLLLTNSSAATILVIGVDGSTVLVLGGIQFTGGSTFLHNGGIAVTDNANHALKVYSAAGVLQQTVWGYGAPHDLLWNGSSLYFDDSFGRFYSLAAGGYPVLLATSASGGFLDYFGGKIYYTNNNVISAMDPVTLVVTHPYTVSGMYTGQVASVAVRPDGALAVADPTIDEVEVVSAAKVVIGTYVGINTPNNVAVDPAGHIFVADRLGSFYAVTEFGANGTSKPVAMMNASYGMAFDPAGNLFIAGAVGASGLFEANLSTGNLNPTRVATPSVNVDFRGLAFSGGTLYVVDNANQVVRSMSGTSLPIYAAGIASPFGVKVGPDGGIYVADRPSGTVQRYFQGTLDIAVGGMSNPNVMNFDASGTLYVGNTGGALYKVSNGTPVDMGLEPLIATSTTFLDINFDNAGVPLVVVNRVGTVNTVLIPTPPNPPSPGSVVFSTNVADPGVALGAQPVSIDFGAWTPQFGGDYTITVTGSGIAGSLSGSLHVGPYAQGQLSADATSVPPGTQPVDLSLSLQGLDFTSIATVGANNIQYSVTDGGNTVPPAMGMGPDGNLYFLSNNRLRQVTPSGVTTTFSNVGQSAQLVGDLVLDPQGRVFINGPTNISLFDPATGTSTVYAHLGGVTSMSMSRIGTLYAAIGDVIYAVSPSGAVKPFYTSPTFFSGLATDDAGNVYLQTNNELVMVTPDGSATLLDNKGSWEGEGRNITGSCSDNMFFTPQIYPNSGQAAEEHTLMEYVGDTGQIVKVFDGLTIASQLGDMDFIAYDRYQSNLMVWTDGSGGQIFTLPVFCGGIDVEAHVVTPGGQTLSGFSAAPTQTISHSDGTTEYVWDLQNVTTIGAGLQFGTTLANLQLGQTQPVVQSAFLTFQNSFVPGSVSTLQLAVPGVSVAPSVALAVSTDAPIYQANMPVNVTLGLSNTSVSDVGGMLDVQVFDAAGNLVADIDDQTETVPAGGSDNETAVWNTGAFLNGAYQVQATLKDPSGVLLAQGSANFSIGATNVAGGDGELTIGVTTDKASYAPTDTVVLDDRLANATSNAIVDNLSYTTTVTNPDGSVRWSNTGTLAELVPGGLKDITVPLALLNAAPGSYGVSLSVSVAGVTLPVATASFTVQSSADTASGVTGSVTATPAQVPVTGLVTLSGQVNNNGNAALGSLTATLAVLDPVAGQLVFQSPVSLANLAQGQSAPLQAAWTAAGNAGQTYVAVLMVTTGGVTKTVAQSNFSLVDPSAGLSGTLAANPAQVPLTTVLTLSGSVSNAAAAINGVTTNITIRDAGGNVVLQAPAGIGALAQGGSAPVQATWTATGAANQSYTATLTATVAGYTRTLAQTGFTVLPPPDPTVNLSGSLSVTPAQVQLGTSLALTANVSDVGTVAVSGITATVAITDSTGQTVFQSSSTIASLGIGDTSQVAANWVAAGTVNQTYTATLTVTAGGKSRQLAQQSFQVVPPPVSMTASLGLGQHGRVLILTDAPGNSDPNGPTGAPGITAQDQHLASVLAAAGWSYRIVTTADDFETQFNTGGYDVYVVLSESAKLSTQFQLQLDQEVSNGAGLLVAGNHDDRNNKLEDALGIHSTGKNLSVTGLNLDASGLVPAGGQAAFPLDPSPESVNKASASVVGEFQVSHGSAVPAVFANGYGSGKAVYVAFDLAMEEAAAGSNNLFDTLFLGSIAYVHPATLTPYQGTVMPFVLTVTDTGVATAGQAVVTLPAGMSVVDPQTGMVSGRTLSWTFNLSQGQVLTLPFWAALPAQAGSVTVTAVVQSGTSPDLVTQATPSLVVGVQGSGHSVCHKLVKDRGEPVPTPKHETSGDKDQH